MARSYADTSRRPARHARRRHRRERTATGVSRGRAGWLVVAVLACGLLAGAAWASAGTSARPVGVERVPAHGGGATRSEPDDAAAGGQAQAQVAAADDARPDDTGPAGDAGVTARAADESAASTTQRAVRVLRGWDRARAAAYTAGSVRSLRELYVAGAGEADVRLLRSYVRRGYRVEDLRMQLLSVRVLQHRPDLWALRVTDRLAGATAVGYGERVDLPRDRASTRTVLLRRDPAGAWRVARVRG
ncbi:MAG: hypothetical protein ACTHKG_06325 [Nocardioides sp.]